MPLVRFMTRSEYSLGEPELYREIDREDPKAVLDGVSVARLVGILRQLGDLTNFAAEIFHGIQEEVMTTASRSHKLMTRVQGIEAAIPPLERAVLAQTSHLHFAYTAGCEWHPRAQSEQNHFVNSDLPRFIMDSYDECRDPPRFHLLDKFDSGGRGSCMKRYSDPTYFRKALRTFREANTEIKRNKKNRKIKKKRSRQRNQGISRLASISDQSSRRQFTSLSINGPTSSSQTASTVDMAVKSDLQDHSNSWDSRSGSIYNLSSYLKPVENESIQSSSFRLKQHSYTVGSVFSDDQSEAVAESLSYCPMQHKKAARESSCGSWDGKDTVKYDAKLDGKQLFEDEAPETTEMNFTSPTDFNGVNEIDRRSEIKDKTRSARKLGIENEPDRERKLEIETKHEIVSELGNDSDEGIMRDGENYVDAPNNIESESENEAEHPTKLQGEDFTCNVKTGRSEDAAYEHIDSYPEYKLSCKLPDLVLSENCFDQQMSQVYGFSSDISHLPGTGICDIHDSSKEETTVIVPFSSTPITSMSDSLDLLRINGIQEPQESQTENQSVNIWTNGNLLGLRPSKPPVFAIPNFASRDIETQDWMDAPSDPQIQTTTCAKASEPIASKPGLNKTVALQENTEIVSGVFGLSQRLLGFLAKEPITVSSKPLTSSLPEAVEVLEQKKPYDQALQELTLEYPFEGLTSSPPLEHMKISFNPASVRPEGSKLRLQFPERAQSHNTNTFPSFQLVPEPAVSIYGLESEADTFCRSSMSSDDYLCYGQSESDSGNWEEHGEASNGKDQGMFKDLQGTTHVQNGEGRPLSNCLLDLPSLDALIAKPQSESQDDSAIFEDHLNMEIVMEPSPPPLPPVQWWVPQTPSESFEDKQQRLQDVLSHDFCRKVSISSDSEHPKVDQVHKDRSDYVPASPKPDIMVNQKLQDNNHSSNGKHTVKGDFLHQIQMKRFNLRRTVTARPSSSTNDPTEDVHIKAVLEKALAIRQAVGTDDGDETDTWSDT